MSNLLRKALKAVGARLELLVNGLFDEGIEKENVPLWRRLIALALLLLLLLVVLGIVLVVLGIALPLLLLLLPVVLGTFILFVIYCYLSLNVFAYCDTCGKPIRKWGGYLVRKPRTDPEADPMLSMFVAATVLGGDDLLCSACASKNASGSKWEAVKWWLRHPGGPRLGR